MTLHVLLSGVVGSTAYGLDRPGSDIDRLGVFAASTGQLLGLRRPKRRFVSHDPDVTMHEVGRWCALALNCNPTVMEVVWLPEDLYETITPRGHELIALRRQFLSAKQVRNSYLGYASGQLKKLKASNVKFPDGRLAGKQARHVGRLLFQGLMLYTTGSLPVRLPPHMVQRCEGLGDLAEAGDLSAVDLTLAEYERQFDLCRSALPDRPDEPNIERWLRHTRQELLRVDIADIETENGAS